MENLINLAISIIDNGSLNKKLGMFLRTYRIKKLATIQKKNRKMIV